MVEGQPIPEYKLRQLGKEVRNIAADKLVSYVLPTFTGIVIWEITNDPKWAMAATGLQILALRSFSGIGKDGK